MAIKSSGVKIPVGVLGVGHMGSYHAGVLSQNYPHDFVGVYDADSKRSKAIAKKHDVKSFSSIEEMTKEIKAVIIATPTSTHYEYTLKMLSENIHVLVEKPFTDNYENALELCQVSKKKNLNLMVGHVERYNGAVQELSKLVDTPYLWLSRRIGPSNNRIKDSGVCLDLFIHDLDICLRTIKSRVCDVKASGVFTQKNRYEDAVSAQITFENGCLATFLACRVSHQKERLLTIIDKNYNLLLDFTTQDITVYKDGQSHITTEPKQIRYQLQSTIERLFIHKENPLKSEIDDFLCSIRDGKTIENELDLETLKIALKVRDTIVKKVD